MEYSSGKQVTVERVRDVLLIRLIGDYIDGGLLQITETHRNIMIVAQ